MPASSPRTLPGLGLKGFFGAGTEGYDTDMDSNMRLVSALCQLRVLSRVTDVPTVGMANGDMYVITAGAEANKVVIRDNGAWVYLPVQSGFRAFDASVGHYIYYNGTAWVDEGSPGQTRVLLSTQVAANSAVLDFPNLPYSAYTRFEFRIQGIRPVTDGAQLMFRTSLNAGSTYDSGASDYYWGMTGTTSGSSSMGATGGAAAQIPVAGNSAVGGLLSNATYSGVFGSLTILNPSDAARHKFIESRTSFMRNINSEQVQNINTSRRTTAGVVSGARFFMASGNIADGYIECWGVK